VSHRSDQPLRVPDKRETRTYTLEGLVKDAGLVGISKRRRVSTFYLCNSYVETSDSVLAVLAFSSWR
jgi:hypothetical protein